jgi:tetraacyldisaccharide 4'-kinase
VTVGGSTLGGSGKTPLAVACTAELARAGVAVTLVGHAYRASPVRARFVASDDRLEDVGDEALVAARALAGSPGARVVVAPTRAAAIALAETSAGVLVLDGVAQTRPARAALALLAVDARDPWGEAGPARSVERLLRGSMARAPRATLLAACDALVPLVDPLDPLAPGAMSDALAALAGLGRPVWSALVASRGAWVGQSRLTWESLRAMRVGLVTALARPERVLRTLGVRGVAPRVVLSVRDHGPLGSSVRHRADAITNAREVDIWLATAKCALHATRMLSGSATGAPLAVIDHTVTLSSELEARLRRLARPHAP